MPPKLRHPDDLPEEFFEPDFEPDFEPEKILDEDSSQIVDTLDKDSLPV